MSCYYKWLPCRSNKDGFCMQRLYTVSSQETISLSSHILFYNLDAGHIASAVPLDSIKVPPTNSNKAPRLDLCTWFKGAFPP